MYTETSLDKVREADIVQVIGNFLDLKKQGANFSAKSPFNTDLTASFMVSPAKQMFKCFSSGKGGDALKFIQEYKHVNFAEAVKIIADICNITLETEAVSEDVQRTRDIQTEMRNIVASVSGEYQKQLNNLDHIHWAKKIVAEREMNADTIVSFAIGYAPSGYQFVTGPIIERGKLTQAKDIGLVKTKEGRNYDFFSDKLMFPIHDVNGNVVAFGSRRSNDADGPKYVNSPESDIYKKSATLYGLFQAKRQIAQKGIAVLVEGYTDVTSLHQHGCDIAVGTGGTALTEQQAILLKKFARHVIIVRDNDGVKEDGSDGAGTKATLRDIDILLLHGFKVSVCILPEKQDPDSYARLLAAKVADGSGHGMTIQPYIFAEMQDGVDWKALRLKTKAANDPDAMSDAVSEISRMLFNIRDDIKRRDYVTRVAKLIGQPKKNLQSLLDQQQKSLESKVEKKGVVDESLEQQLGLPKGADYREYMATRFTTINNCYWFKGKEGFFPGTNFIFKPLYHVVGRDETRRVCEVVNTDNEKRLIDFESKHLVQMTQMEDKLINTGNFKFLENTTPNHFKLIRQQLLNGFALAHEITDLGWQEKKFFAYADCVYYKGVIKNVNEYGIVMLDEELETSGDYHQTSRNFYLPAFSEMHKHDNSNNDEYENDRYCVFRKSPVELHDWMAQMLKVYNDKAITGIAYCFASMFRDIFMRRYQYFPHMFLTGEKGSGKSKFGESLAALFTYKQPAFDLNGGTHVAFYRRLARYKNSVTLLEEYHDNIDVKIFQGIKGAADGRGRELGKGTGDNKTMSTKINCALIILGQYLSARDDNSVTTRSILNHFLKRLESYTTEDIENYALLKSWEEQGLNSLLIDILQHRDYVELNMHEMYASLSKKMKAELGGKAYEQRVLESYITMLTTMKLLWEKFKFPFSYDNMWNLFKDAIVDSSDLIVESEGLAQFWNILEYLRDRKPFSLLIDGLHFKIDTPDKIRLQTRKGEEDREWKNEPRRQVIYLRLNAVHQLYHKEASTREGTDIIGENTLKNYFKSKKYYIGSVKSMRFDDTSTSAYCFDYDMMEEGNILNLVRTTVMPAENTEIVDPSHPGAPNDDLPF